MIMKTKTLALVAFTMFNLQFTTSMMAQGQNQQNREAMRTEMINRQADRLVKDLNLKGDEKTAFVETYKAYQREVMESQRDGRTRMGNQQQGNQNEKKLTDEEAKKAVEQYFERQERQITQMQKKLEIDRRYYEEFSKTLTPQQLTRIFQQNNRQNQPGNRQFQQGNRQRPEGFGGMGGDRGGFGGNGGGMGGDF